VGRISLIVNPFATNVTEKRLKAVEVSLARAGEVETRLTERAGHAAELAAAVEGGVDAIVVYGGDGSVNEALNGLDGKTPFGAVPGGGTSVFARALGLPKRSDDAAAQLADSILAGRTRRITLGRVSGRRFAFSAGIGFDAEAVRRVDELGRTHDGRRPGDLAFATQLARVLASHRLRFEPELEIVGLGRAAFMLVANCDPYTYAGPLKLRIAPQASFELGLDIVAPVRLTAGTMPRFARYVLLGKGQESSPDVIYAHDVDRVEVRCDRPLPLQADGEDLGDVDHAVFEAEREAISVFH
jgi:diacylglycerol kinase family enzyme